jgi:hypothetical protein
MSVHTGVRVPPRSPGFDGLVALAPTLLVLLATIAAAGFAISAGGHGPPARPAAAIEYASLSQPTTFYLVNAADAQAFAASPWASAVDPQHIIAVGTPQEEQTFLGFVEAANSFLLAGGLPGYEVVNLLHP